MKKGSTEMVFILDRSGSMTGLESDTIGGFNSTIRQQREKEGEATVTTILFDNRYEVLHDRFDISQVGEMTSEEYYTRGSTALLDAMGSSIQKTISVQKNLPQKDKAEHVVFVIITDGYENSSCEYTYKDIRRMVGRQQERYGWEFIFLGANIDAIEEGGRLGIRSDRAVRYVHDDIGTAVAYQSVNNALRSLRDDGEVEECWCAPAADDFKVRGNDDDCSF